MAYPSTSSTSKRRPRPRPHHLRNPTVTRLDRLIVERPRYARWAVSREGELHEYQSRLGPNGPAGGVSPDAGGLRPNRACTSRNFGARGATTHNSGAYLCTSSNRRSGRGHNL